MLDELESNLATLGGRPRSVESLPAELAGARRRRQTDPDTFTLVLGSAPRARVRREAGQEMTDVNTSRIIQVSCLVDHRV